MRYQVTVGVHELVVEVLDDAVLVNGRKVPVGLDPVPHTPLFQLRMGNENTRLAMHYSDGQWMVQDDGREWAVKVLDERMSRVTQLGLGERRGVGGGIIKAPMPGLVLRLEVEEGQTVEKGQGLLVLEAMKMENEIRAAAPGVVRRILVDQGMAVEKGVAMLELEPVS